MNNKLIVPQYSCGTDDITFCISECDHNECFRHPANIINREIPHSYADLKSTELCTLKKEYDRNDTV